MTEGLKYFLTFLAGFNCGALTLAAQLIYSLKSGRHRRRERT